MDRGHMPNLPEEMQEKIRQLQMIEQQLQQLMLQKQTHQLQVMETDSALKELSGAGEAYKIIGSIMVLTNRESLEKDLKEKKETAELRISSLEKQEAKTRERASALQKEVIAAMNKK